MANVLDIRAIGKGFFDSAEVLRRLSAGERRVLSKWGAFVRTAAQRSIRKRKKPSAPGQAPSSHEGSLRRLIMMAYDAARRSVVAGPLAFRGKAGVSVVPRVLEEGGPITNTLVRLPGGRLVGPNSPLLKGAPGGRETVVKSATIAPRPYMGPAAAKVNGQLAPMLKDML